MLKFSFLLVTLASLQTVTANTVNVCGCFCSNDGTTVSIPNLVGGFQTSSQSLCSLAACNTNYNANTQCSTYGYVIAEYIPNVTPDATLVLAATSGCTFSNIPITVGGSDCNSQCMSGFSVGTDAGLGVNLLVPTYMGATCTCPVGEYVVTSTGSQAAAGYGVLITPSVSDPNINFGWVAATEGGSAGYAMSGTGALAGCTLGYEIQTPSSSPAADVVKPIAALFAAAAAAILL